MLTSCLIEDKTNNLAKSSVKLKQFGQDCQIFRRFSDRLPSEQQEIMGYQRHYSDKFNQLTTVEFAIYYRIEHFAVKDALQSSETLAGFRLKLFTNRQVRDFSVLFG